MTPRYKVTLTPEECDELKALTRNGKTPVKKFITDSTRPSTHQIKHSH